ncbi:MULTISPECIES: hypothetical protein [Nostocaceae]|uniref:hypothetical protein n=1 Tax=Nostocaceae TaxID=1162 RepID=UPI001D17768D|nr:MULTISPECIES: hypothetical protein [Nostocaceae]
MPSVVRASVSSYFALVHERSEYASVNLLTASTPTPHLIRKLTVVYRFTVWTGEHQ